MSTTWDPESPSLKPTIVCYADILGFRSMTERALKSGTEGEFLNQSQGGMCICRTPGIGPRVLQECFGL